MELKGLVKLVHSLQQKKIRQEKGLFLVEGDKMVKELLAGGTGTRIIAASEEWVKDNHRIIAPSIEHISVTADELKKLSGLVTPNLVLAVAEIPAETFRIEQLSGKLSIMLDEVQDPGNLGTIIRLADWFGIETIFCSKGTVDAYNPKVVQATMGSILRIKLHYVDAVEFLGSYKKILNAPVYGAYLEGKDIYASRLSGQGLLIMGNESSGISSRTGRFVDERINIPRAASARAESLNVAVATAVICAEFFRNQRES